MATNEVQHDLLNAKQLGEIAMEDFKSNRLTFSDKLKKLKLKTFSDLTPSKKVVKDGKEIILKMDKELLGRMAIIAQERSIDVKEVFSYPNGPAPWSLAGHWDRCEKQISPLLSKISQKKSL